MALQNAVTIAVTCKKGGVGKTTVALNMGVALAALGYKVAVVDLDPQGHISISFDMVGDDGLPIEGIFRMLCNEPKADVWEVVYVAPRDEYEKMIRVPGGELIVVPGGSKTTLASVNIQMRGEDYDALSIALEPLKKEYDVMIFDTAPSNSLFTAGIYQAADFALIPTKLSRLESDGVYHTLREMDKLKALHQTRLLGILPTFTQMNVKEDQRRLAELIQQFGDKVWNDVAIPYSAVWKSASDEARSIFSYESETNPAGKKNAEAAMWAVVEKVVAKVGLVKQGEK